MVSVRKPVQTEMAFKSHGGKRKGAGRPRKQGRASEHHKKRPAHNAHQPVHVTLRIVTGMDSLRRRHTFHALREATLTAAWRDDFRIVHMSIQSNHVHLLVEAEDQRALSKGVWGFEVSAARHINRAIGERTGIRRRGAVFADRYHARALTSPREARNCIRYILNNWLHHGEHTAPFARTWQIDPYASGIFFEGWKEREQEVWCFQPPKGYEPLVVWRPRTWLLKTGWSKHHGMISTREVPGGH
jgi:REP element-mobilizing transposase RayT